MLLSFFTVFTFICSTFAIECGGTNCPDDITCCINNRCPVDEGCGGIPQIVIVIIAFFVVALIIAFIFAMLSHRRRSQEEEEIKLIVKIPTQSKKNTRSVVDTKANKNIKISFEESESVLMNNNTNEFKMIVADNDTFK